MEPAELDDDAPDEDFPCNPERNGIFPRDGSWKPPDPDPDPRKNGDLFKKIFFTFQFYKPWDN